MSKFIYKRRDVREFFGITEYGLNKILRNGILDAPISEEGSKSYWTSVMIRRAEQRLLDLSRPKVIETTTTTTRPLNDKQVAQCRAHKQKQLAQSGREAARRATQAARQ